MKKDRDIAPIYVSRVLHTKLKEMAARKQLKLHELCEKRLGTLFKTAAVDMSGNGKAGK